MLARLSGSSSMYQRFGSCRLGRGAFGHAREGRSTCPGDPVTGVGRRLLAAFGKHAVRSDMVTEDQRQSRRQCNGAGTTSALPGWPSSSPDEVPQRAPRIERFHRQVAHEILQRRLLADTAAPGQRDALHVGFDVKRWSSIRWRLVASSDHALAKARVLQQAFPARARARRRARCRAPRTTRR